MILCIMDKLLPRWMGDGILGGDDIIRDSASRSFFFFSSSSSGVAGVRGVAGRSELERP